MAKDQLRRRYVRAAGGFRYHIVETLDDFLPLRTVALCGFQPTGHRGRWTGEAQEGQLEEKHICEKCRKERDCK